MWNSVLYLSPSEHLLLIGRSKLVVVVHLLHGTTFLKESVNKIQNNRKMRLDGFLAGHLIHFPEHSKFLAIFENVGQCVYIN